MSGGFAGILTRTPVFTTRRTVFCWLCQLLHEQPLFFSSIGGALRHFQALVLFFFSNIGKLKVMKIIKAAFFARHVRFGFTTKHGPPDAEGMRRRDAYLKKKMSENKSCELR